MYVGRTARATEPDTVLHIIDRGVERREIFSNDGDCQFFLSCMKESFKTFGVRLYSYCLMVNHFHLLAAPGVIPIGVAMHHILTRYAHYYNERMGRVGHLFQSRFKSIPCFDLGYFVNLVAYIHLNPVRAGLVLNPAAWPWSSHSQVLGDSDGTLQLESIPQLVGISVEEMRTAYLSRISDSSHRGQSAEEIIREAAAFVGLDLPAFREGGKGESYTMGRRLVTEWGTSAGYSLVTLAQLLNCSPQALSQLKRRNTTASVA